MNFDVKLDPNVRYDRLPQLHVRMEQIWLPSTGVHLVLCAYATVDGNGIKESAATLRTLQQDLRLVRAQSKLGGFPAFTLYENNNLRSNLVLPSIMKIQYQVCNNGPGYRQLLLSRR